MALRDVSRGDVLAGGRDLRPSQGARRGARVRRREPSPTTATRVQVHHGTREAPARLRRLGGRFWQVRLEQPLIAAAGDRLVIRRLAPPDTLGGGVVLDPAPAASRRRTS